jgi:hypothetical protein
VLSVAGCSNRRSNKAAGSPATEAYPWGTSQGDGRLRTTLGVYFSILLGFGAAEADVTIARFRRQLEAPIGEKIFRQV